MVDQRLRELAPRGWALAVCVAVSLAATIYVLAGGGDPDAAVLAARAELHHAPNRVVEELIASAGGMTTETSGPSAPVAPVAPSAANSAAGAATGGAATSASSSASTSPDTGAGGGSGHALVGAAPSGEGPTRSAAPAPAPNSGLPRIGHVFLLTLSSTGERTSFGPASSVPYLRALARRGTLLSGYRGLGRGALADLLALLSGQPPNPDTSRGCPTYALFPASATVSRTGVAAGRGCIYPDAVLTLADQVNAAGHTWGAYVGSMGTRNCAVPATGAPLDTTIAGTGPGYDLAQNPFAFFGAEVDAGACAQHDQDLSALPGALARPGRTPTFTYLAGDACVSARPASTGPMTGTATTGGSAGAGPAPATTTAASTTTAPAAVGPSSPTGTGTSTAAGATTTSTGSSQPAATGCPAGSVAGPPAENGFLRHWVPAILTSEAYRRDGVLIIASTGAGTAARTPLGALVLSRYARRGRRIGTAVTPFGLLHTLESLLDVRPLARAATAPSLARRLLTRS